MTEDANRDGYFVGPTIFSEVKKGMQIYVSGSVDDFFFVGSSIDVCLLGVFAPAWSSIGRILQSFEVRSVSFEVFQSPVHSSKGKRNNDLQNSIVNNVIKKFVAFVFLMLVHLSFALQKKNERSNYISLTLDHSPLGI